jgi:hypothetical protein
MPRSLCCAGFLDAGAWRNVPFRGPGPRGTELTGCGSAAAKWLASQREPKLGPVGSSSSVSVSDGGARAAVTCRAGLGGCGHRATATAAAGAARAGPGWRP